MSTYQNIYILQYILYVSRRSRDIKVIRNRIITISRVHQCLLISYNKIKNSTKRVNIKLLMPVIPRHFLIDYS